MNNFFQTNSVEIQTSIPNWEFLYVNTFEAIPIPGMNNLYERIPPQRIPVLIESTILVINCTPDRFDPSWKWGCDASQLLPHPGIVNERVVGATRRVPPGKHQIVVFPELVDSYELELTFPYWFRSVTVTIWQYLGNSLDVSESRLSSLLLEILDKVNEENS